MKRIYMAQPNSKYGNSVYFPYAAGSLIAYAFTDTEVQKNYDFGCFFYKKDDIGDVIDSLNEPAVFGFSCYVWNYEYNKALAAAVKKKWPSCVTIFGGHQVYRGSDIIIDANVDIVQFGEGEESFRRILLALAGTDELSAIPNIMYRENGRPVFSSEEIVCIPQRVSPYLNGWFDDMLQTEKEVVFSAILETNRGCPNKCAFCDWGNIKARVRLFDEAMVRAEIDWFSVHQIEYVYAADANFGLFPRDDGFVDYLIQKHDETGFPQKFQATYSKNNPDTVFLLNKKLNDAGMSKGATLSFQSMSEDVMNNIYRKNMPLEHFKRLMQLYNENGIAAYSEIILGLPGESYESFREGLELLLENGQHMSINIFNCELLNNSIMNDPAYIERYQIRTARIEQHQYHVVPYDIGIQEYSNIVVSTSTMPADKWIDANILGVFVRAFHNLGLLQCFAIFLFYEKNVPYMTFYEQLIQYAKNNPQSVCGKIYVWLRQKLAEVIRNKGSLTWNEPAFGDLTWPLEEATFLKVVKNLDSYRAEIIPFISSFFEDADLFRDLLLYQNNVVKTPISKTVTLRMKHNWFAYFSAIYETDYIELKEQDCLMRINPRNVFSDLPEFAIETIWFGRRGSKNIISDIRLL